MTMMGIKAQFVEYKPVYVNPPYAAQLSTIL